MTDTPPRSPRNEAAERLRQWILEQTGYHESHFDDRIDAALAEERRHVVAQIKRDMPAAVLATDGGPVVAYAMRVTAYLDDLSVDSSTPEQKR